MSLSRCALVLAVLLSSFAARRATADERRASPTVELMSGYGLELVKVGTYGTSAHGVGLGTRAGVALPAHLYLGGTFVHHFGWKQQANDEGRSSTYRAAYHMTYAGAELGWSLEHGALLLRGYLGTGVLVAFGRTVVRNVERRDDNAFFYVAPGLLTAARIGRWYGGLDLRFMMVPAQLTSQWAPALFLVVGRAP